MAHAPSLKCPICRRALATDKPTPTHPFCSPRCKLVDLGNWLGDGYVIAGQSVDPSSGEPVLDEDLLLAMLREPS
jgi:endogenous inhibitor of DNA gyrase (YacG/DUF329 family)